MTASVFLLFLVGVVFMISFTLSCANYIKKKFLNVIYVYFINIYIPLTTIIGFCSAGTSTFNLDKLSSISLFWFKLLLIMLNSKNVFLLYFN